MHVMTPPQPPKRTPFDVVDDPAFKAAATSRSLKLLPQEEVLAHSEAHFGVVQIESTYNIISAYNLKIAAFRYRFRRDDGHVDFSRATSQDLDAYEGILDESLWAIAEFRHWNQETVDVQKALLKGDRDLETLRKAEHFGHPPAAPLVMSY